MPLKEVNNTEKKEDRIDELEIPIESGELLLHASQVILIEQLEDRITSYNVCYTKLLRSE